MDPGLGCHLRQFGLLGAEHAVALAGLCQIAGNDRAGRGEGLALELVVEAGVEPCTMPKAPNDIPEAVAARLARSRFLHEGDHRFVVLIEEGARCTQIDTTATMAGQLAHLLAVMPLPSVSLGIIPFGVPRTMWPLEAFCLYNDQHTVIETLTTSISVRQPRARARRVSRVRPRSERH